MKMVITSKTQRRIRYFIITLAIICLTPIIENGRILNGAHSTKAYGGKDIVCAIDLGNDMYSSHALETGLNYELLQKFGRDNHCKVTIISARKDENYIDSLKHGKVDIVVTNNNDILCDKSLTALTQINRHSTWTLSSDAHEQIRQIDNWLGYTRSSDEFKDLKMTFSGKIDPKKKAEKGELTNTISPYDRLIRQYAAELGWDWRMLAAVVYQESRFSISSRSSRGAQGLMQVMPQTGKYYGVDNLLDPEQNILAGTRHLKRLQNMFLKYDMEHEELVKFTLAAYNAGEGRITDCRNLAAAKGYDNSRWDEIVKVIPLMRDDSIMEEESVKLGKFQGHETIDYITSVLSHYRAICKITSL